MDKFDEWLEEYKHLDGQHNQKKHGFRGSANVGQAAVSTSQPKLSATGQKVLASLSKNPGKTANYLKTVMPKVHAELLSKGYIDSAGKLTSGANANAQPAKNTVVNLKLDNKSIDIGNFQSGGTKLSEVVKINGKKDKAVFEAPSRVDVKIAQSRVQKWVDDNLADGRVTHTSSYGREMHNGVMADKYSFFMYDSGKRSVIPGAQSFVNPNQHEIEFEFWIAP